MLLTIFLCDQLTKSFVDNSIAPGEHRPLLHGVELVDVRNHEFVLGFIPVGTQLRMILGVLGMSIAFAVCFRYFRRHTASGLVWLPIGLMLGGGLGNMFDLLSRGSATDFIELPSGRIVFNLADASVTIGMLMLIYMRALRTVPAQKPNTQLL